MKRGRPKGYSPYVEIAYEDLADYVGKKTLVKVCKSWIEDLVKQTQSTSNTLNINTSEIPMTEIIEQSEQEQPKIEFNITNFDE